MKTTECRQTAVLGAVLFFFLGTIFGLATSPITAQLSQLPSHNIQTIEAPTPQWDSFIIALAGPSTSWQAVISDRIAILLRVISLILFLIWIPIGLISVGPIETKTKLRANAIVGSLFFIFIFLAINGKNERQYLKIAAERIEALGDKR